MANKQDSKKRRVAAARQEEARRVAAARRDRRRRLIVGGVTGFLALALIAPLTAGLVLSGSDDPTVVTSTTTSLPDLPWVPPELAGASLDAPTPCPPEDGSAPRTTGFATAPPQCIGDTDTFDLTFATDVGDELTVPVDASLAAEAVNLAVVFARYHTYEQTRLSTVNDGLLWIGGEGDTGFSLPPSIEPQTYEVGSVVAIADLDGALSGALGVVLDEVTVQLLSLDPRHVVIGKLDDIDAVRKLTDATITGVTATETS